MSEHRPVGRVEDYTIPFLVTSGVTLFMALFVTAAAHGWTTVFAIVLILDAIITRNWPLQPNASKAASQKPTSPES